MWGDRPLFDELVERFDEKSGARTRPPNTSRPSGRAGQPPFQGGPRARYLVRAQRQGRQGRLCATSTRCSWIGKYHFGCAAATNWSKEGRTSTRKEYLAVPQGRGLPVGGALGPTVHFLTGRAPKSGLHFDIPAPKIAERLGYNEASRPAGRRAAS